MKNSILKVLLITLVSGRLHAQTSPVKASIDKLLADWETKQAPGIAIAVVKKGEVLYNRSLGMANIKDQLDNDSLTRFWIASVTKQFTAAAIYLLETQKKLNVHHSVRGYLPDLPAIFQTVTIDHLLHHTSGIRDGFVLTALSKKPEELYTNENVWKYLSQQSASNFKPGTDFEYNNSGYVLLAMVIEKLSGMSYPGYMKEKIFDPLGMIHTYVSGQFPQQVDQAEGYRSKDYSNKPGSFEEGHFKGDTYGSTGVITTISDLVRWTQVLQDPKKVTFFTPVINNLLQTSKLLDGSIVNYAGGLEKFIYRGRQVYEHFGSDEGFKANILYFPSSRISVIGLTNNSTYFNLSNLLYEIADLVHGETKRVTSINENSGDSLLSETRFYNKDWPQFFLVKQYSNYVRIGNTLNGYAAPYIRLKDTVKGLDAIPAKFLLKPAALVMINPNHHKLQPAEKIIPEKDITDLKQMEGTYYSAELQADYKIIANEKTLVFEFVPGMTFDMYRLTKTDFMFDYLGSNFLQFTGEGFYFSREGCRKLLFKNMPGK